jgi:ABC-2 type transport system permease protein
MRPTLSLIRREFSAYFYSPIAYVLLFVFLLVTGRCFIWSMEALTAQGPRGITNPMEIMVNSVLFWLAFLTIPPILTMRLVAEERSSGTLEMLLTAPIRDWQVVFAKFAACYGFYVVMWLPTLLYLPILADWQFDYVPYQLDWGPECTAYAAIGGTFALMTLGLLILSLLQFIDGKILAGFGSLLLGIIIAGLVTGAVLVIWQEGYWMTIWSSVDPWPIVTTYLGLALAGAMFLSIGLFISSLVKSQLVAALLAIFIGMLFIGGMWRPEMDTSGMEYRLLSYFTVPMHFERNFGRGLIDTRNLVLYSSVALLVLFLTVRSLESRRWQ